MTASIIGSNGIFTWWHIIPLTDRSLLPGTVAFKAGEMPTVPTLYIPNPNRHQDDPPTEGRSVSRPHSLQAPFQETAETHRVPLTTTPHHRFLELRPAADEVPGPPRSQSPPKHTGQVPWESLPLGVRLSVFDCHSWKNSPCAVIKFRATERWAKGNSFVKV